MSDQYLGEIRMFAGNYAPEGWHLCDGSVLSINGNEALFSVMGTTYGGDGVTTFGLPDLRGRVLVHQGTLAGATYVLGQQAGTEKVTLQAAELPAHTHAVSAQNEPAQLDTPVNNYWSQSQVYTPTATTTMDPALVSSFGGNQAHENMMPFLAINFIIAVEGNYPSPS